MPKTQRSLSKKFSGSVSHKHPAALICVISPSINLLSVTMSVKGPARLWSGMKALNSRVARIAGCQGLSAEAGTLMMMMVVVVQWWLDWVKWVRSEVSGHASDTGVWCDPLAVGRMDSGQLSSCRPMQDAGSHGANKSEEVRVTLAEKFTALHFTALLWAAALL